MSSVAFDGVSKVFDETVAVESLTLAIDDGEFLVLLGPSGCGKSTALRMLAGLETPTEGRVWLGEVDVTDVDPRNRDVAMVFQSYALYPHMTVAKNIESPLIGRGDGLDRAQRRSQVEHAASMLGLDSLLDRKPGQLSGGQRQRVALARAIVRQPAAFLMDEPLSNLDAKLRTQTRGELVRLHRELDATFIYVTHDQVEAMTMATRIAILDEGRLQQVGTPREIYERPANRFVAQFIGSPPMNVLSAAVVDGGRAVQVHDGRLELPSRRPALVDGTVVDVGVRPEHLVPSTDGGVEATVLSSEWLGHEQIVRLDADGNHFDLRDPQAHLAAAVGDRVRLGAAPDQIHLFDPNSGERLDPA